MRVRRRPQLPMLLLPPLLLLSACGGDGGEGAAAGSAGGTPAAGDPRALTYAAELGVELAEFQQTPTGLLYKDDLVGSGDEAVAGRTVTVHYTGFHPDGRVFDTSLEAAAPFTFALGAGQVIAGWDQGVAGMKVGGRRILVIPPQLGYGERGAGGGVIPPNAVLVFRVELLSVG